MDLTDKKTLKSMRLSLLVFMYKKSPPSDKKLITDYLTDLLNISQIGLDTLTHDLDYRGRSYRYNKIELEILKKFKDCIVVDNKELINQHVIEKIKEL